jgi:hypothetical protein
MTFSMICKFFLSNIKPILDKMDNNLIVPKNILKRKNKTERQKLPSNIFAGNEDSIPDKIIVYYSDKINIEQIDLAIRYKFNKSKEGIGDIINQIKDLEISKDVCKYNNEKYYYDKLIKEKSDILEDWKNDISLKKYINETSDIIEKYYETNDIKYAEYYLLKAGKYINIERIKKLENKFQCKGCKADLSDLNENLEGFYVCIECNSINQALKPTKYTKDLENYNSVYEEDITNFMKILDKFEGRNTVEIHNELYGELDEYFISKNMKNGEYYRNLPLLENGKKEGTNRKRLWSALEALGYNQYYDETSYIAHIYWGWKIPDLSLYRDQILKDYQNTQQVWSRIKHEYKRSASLGTQYRLYVHLLAVGYPYCERDDFKIQDMVESLRLHNHAWERMCQECNIKFYEVSS